jgi:hypothetical protein
MGFINAQNLLIRLNYRGSSKPGNLQTIYNAFVNNRAMCAECRWVQNTLSAAENGIPTPSVEFSLELGAGAVNPLGLLYGQHANLSKVYATINFLFGLQESQVQAYFLPSGQIDLGPATVPNGQGTMMAIVTDENGISHSAPIDPGSTPGTGTEMESKAFLFALIPGPNLFGVTLFGNGLPRWAWIAATAVAAYKTVDSDKPVIKALFAGIGLYTLQQSIKPVE